ncbi:MAG: 16S rRNA (uracil(1498)-N(3))-methyltransferase [Alphaproteobacteria bacterium]|nr:16S rRNA (uracil(1498)-N(3))-methyltransferase [Alphaproteobacteria bacterium]
MRSPRLYLPEPLAEGAVLRLADKTAHYLVHVLRLGPGSQVRLFNGEDGEFAATIEERSRDGLTVRVGSQVRGPRPEADLTLVFAPLKRGPTDWVIEKATELGVTAIQPVLTAYTVAETVRLERWEAIAREAAEQCERLTAPQILEPAPLARLLGDWPERRRLLVGEARASGLVTVAQALADDPAASALLIGPEGGFDARELGALCAHPAARGVTFGRRILRAETAAVAGLALVQAAWGDRRAG